jgi:hypothetical protein
MRQRRHAIIDADLRHYACRYSPRAIIAMPLFRRYSLIICHFHLLLLSHVATISPAILPPPLLFSRLMPPTPPFSRRWLIDAIAAAADTERAILRSIRQLITP